MENQEKRRAFRRLLMVKRSSLKSLTVLKLHLRKLSSCTDHQFRAASVETINALMAKERELLFTINTEIDVFGLRYPDWTTKWKTEWNEEQAIEIEAEKNDVFKTPHVYKPKIK